MNFLKNLIGILLEVIMMNILKNEKGQSIVEFALLLPILILIIMAIIEFGLLLNTYLALNNASREGARIGIVGGTDAQIQNTVLTTSPTLESRYISVVITPSQASRKAGDTLKVTVYYQYHTIIPIIGNIINNIVNLNAETSMRIE
jgi:Flp pilus assembly protein TadG